MGPPSGVAMSPATIDRRLQSAKVLARFAGRSHTKPGSLLKSQIPIRTWSEWDDATPGFVEIDLVGHEGGNSFGEFCFTLTVTDIATGWTVNRSVLNKAAIHVVAAIDDVWRSSRSRSWGSTPTTVRSSSTSISTSTAWPARSPSPARGRATRTTAPTSSRRTGPMSAASSATSATTPPPNSSSSTRSGRSISASRTCCAHNNSSSHTCGPAPKSSNVTTPPRPRVNERSPPACSPPPTRPRSPSELNQIHPGDLQRQIDTLITRLERLALTKTTTPARPINTAFNHRDHPEILGEATTHRFPEN